MPDPCRGPGRDQDPRRGEGDEARLHEGALGAGARLPAAGRRHPRDRRHQGVAAQRGARGGAQPGTRHNGGQPVER